MNIVFAFLITLLVYPLLGTFLFALVEKISISIIGKTLILTLGHPILTGLIVWFGCSTFNHEIAKTGVIFAAGTLIRVPFSSRKYFSGLIKDSEALMISYITPVMQRKSIKISLPDIQKITQSKTPHLFDKPSTLTVTLTDQVIEFDVLERKAIDLNLR